MFGKMIALAGGCFLVCSAAAFANSSTYTDLNLDQCEKITEYEDGVQLKCDGYGDYPVYLKEGDLRQAVLFGKVKQVLIDEAFESFGPFNHVNTKIEWRLDEQGKPIAAILRWFIENTNPETGAVDKDSTGQVLVVSSVADIDGVGCVVGYVDALDNPNANILARNIADYVAGGFSCAYNKPMWWGTRGEKAGQSMNYLPDSILGE